MRILTWKCALLVVFVGLAFSPSIHAQVSIAPTDLPASAEQKIRNVILLIGDGMGPQQLGLLFDYANLASGTQVPDRMAALEHMARHGAVAIVRTEPHGALVADSAAAATQLATGQKAGSEMIGINYLGDRVATVLEIAEQHGKSTGLVTDTRVTHATPAAFAAHQRHRRLENEIAVDMLESGVDVLLGGGLRQWLPQAVNKRGSAAHMAAVQMTAGQFEVSSRRQDNRNLLVEARSDHQLVFDRFALTKLNQGRVLGLFADSEMMDALAERRASARDDRTQPTLAEMAAKSLELLSQDPDGFFLMVEGGQIDWAGHNNDTGTLLHELLRFDETVRTVLDWAKSRQDTLVLVTADHETGGFGFSYSGSPLPKPRELAGDAFDDHPFLPDFNFGSPSVLDKIYAQQKSFFAIFLEFDALDAAERTPEKLKAMVNSSMEFKITTADAVDILKRETNRQYQSGHKFLGGETVPLIADFRSFFVYGENARMNLLGRKLAAQQNTVWATGSHTSTPVLLIAHGPPAVTQRFTGLLHATEVGQRLIQVVRGN